jgi:hypothetical protein
LLCKLAFFNRYKPNTLKYVDTPPRSFEAKKGNREPIAIANKYR